MTHMFTPLSLDNFTRKKTSQMTLMSFFRRIRELVFVTVGPVVVNFFAIVTLLLLFCCCFFPGFVVAFFIRFGCVSGFGHGICNKHWYVCMYPVFVPMQGGCLAKEL